MTLSQISPFNEARFDACMRYLSSQHTRPLDQYEMMKLHVMTDIFHTLRYGAPVIGGSLDAWTFGPVVAEAYARVRRWIKEYDRLGQEPDGFVFSYEDARSRAFEASSAPSDDEFSQSEVQAMNEAWELVTKMDFGESQRYFHSSSFVGKAWQRARQEDRPVDWDDIIDEYDQEYGTDHTHIKTLVAT